MGGVGLRVCLCVERCGESEGGRLRQMLMERRGNLSLLCKVMRAVGHAGQHRLAGR